MIPPVAETMTALRKSAAEPGLRLEEIPVPVPAADEVLVEVETASVCGTDLHIYGWDEWSQGRINPPLTLGHEFAGTVVDRGELVQNVASATMSRPRATSPAACASSAAPAMRTCASARAFSG